MGQVQAHVVHRVCMVVRRQSKTLLCCVFSGNLVGLMAFFAAASEQ